jgi:hypothetical protein
MYPYYQSAKSTQSCILSTNSVLLAKENGKTRLHNSANCWGLVQAELEKYENNAVDAFSKFVSSVFFSLAIFCNLCNNRKVQCSFCLSSRIYLVFLPNLWVLILES